MPRIMAIFAILIPFILAGCEGTDIATPSAEVVGKPVSVDGGFYTDVSTAELQTMLKNKNFVFINVHIPFEGDIAGTDLSIAYDEIEQNLQALPAEKDAKIVLYCRSDRMSRIAAETLVSLGYTNVWNLEGGMVAWERAGLPLER